MGVDLPSKADVLAILRSRQYGSTIAQFLRDFRLLLGKDFLFDKWQYNSVEDVLSKNYSDVIKIETSEQGETLLYAIIANDKFLPTFFERKSAYDIKEQIEKLEPDERGWFTICFVIPKGIFIESDLRQDFEMIGNLADFHVNMKGRVFVRYMSHESAVKALKKYGAQYRIYIGHNKKKNNIEEVKEKIHEVMDSNEEETLPKNNLNFDKIVRDESTTENDDLPPPLIDVNFDLLNLNEPPKGKNSPDHLFCIHSKTPCRFFPNCHSNCDFLHPVCENGELCVNESCKKHHPNRSKKRCNLCSKRSNPRYSVDSSDWIFQCEHRDEFCKSFPNCSRKASCSFKHPSCPESCNNWKQCPYDHHGQTKPCFICTKLKTNTRLSLTNSDGTSSSSSSDVTNAYFTNSYESKESIRSQICRYGIKCWRTDCFFEHPEGWIQKACPWGVSCKRDKCSFIHPSSVS